MFKQFLKYFKQCLVIEESNKENRQIGYFDFKKYNYCRLRSTSGNIILSEYTSNLPDEIYSVLDIFNGKLVNVSENNFPSNLYFLNLNESTVITWFKTLFYSLGWELLDIKLMHVQYVNKNLWNRVIPYKYNNPYYMVCLKYCQPSFIYDKLFIPQFENDYEYKFVDIYFEDGYIQFIIDGDEINQHLSFKDFVLEYKIYSLCCRGSTCRKIHLGKTKLSKNGLYKFFDYLLYLMYLNLNDEGLILLNNYFHKDKIYY